MTFHEKLRAFRERRSLSQGELAQMIGRPQARISKWESGEGNPDPTNLLRISEALQLPLRFLCDDSLDDPDQTLDAGPVTETARTIWTVVGVLGPERSIARLMGLPEPAPAPQPGTPPLAGPAPEPTGKAKRLGRTPLTKLPEPPAGPAGDCPAPAGSPAGAKGRAPKGKAPKKKPGPR